MKHELRRKATVALGFAAAVALLPASAAFASGPGGGSGNGSGNNGRNQIRIDCANGQSYLIAVSNGGKSNSAGQVVDAKGHGIPAYGTFSVMNLNPDASPTSVVLGNIGHGNGHSNQVTTECTGQTFSGIVSDLGPPPYPGNWSGAIPSLAPWTCSSS